MARTPELNPPPRSFIISFFFFFFSPSKKKTGKEKTTTIIQRNKTKMWCVCVYARLALSLGFRFCLSPKRTHALYRPLARRMDTRRGVRVCCARWVSTELCTHRPTRHDATREMSFFFLFLHSFFLSFSNVIAIASAVPHPSSATSIAYKILSSAAAKKKKNLMSW